MYKRISAVVLSCVLCVLPLAQAADTNGPPNILLIFVDDLPWHMTPVRMDERMNNSGTDVLRRLEDPNNPGTPYYWNTQKLADEGIIFRNAYASAPQCAPSRVSLQTGMTTARTRWGVTTSSSNGPDDIYKNGFDKYPVIPNKVQSPLADTITTIPEALAPMGYRCAHYGKWHMETDPSVEGYVESDGSTGNGAGASDDPMDPKRTYSMTDRAINFMNDSVGTNQPFYIQMSYYAVHAGYQALPSSQALFEDDPDVSNNATYFGMIYDLDLNIGMLLDHLDSLGIADNTYVIFTSDNGRRHGVSNLTQPLYGDKWILWQGGIRVPMIVRGPGIPAKSINTINVVHYDFLPTYYEWAGGDPADLSNIDGISLKGLMEGEAPSETFLNRLIYFHYPYYRNSQPMSVAVKGKYKLVHSYDGAARRDPFTKESIMDNPDMLFDLSVDPGEFHNINTSPTNSPVAEELSTDLDNYLASVGAWLPLDNEAAYLADLAASDASFADADTNNDFYADFEYIARRDKPIKWPGCFLFPPFEGNRAVENYRDEADKSPGEYWMDSWGVDIGTETNDYDGDGVVNLLEYALGSDPTDPLSIGIEPVLEHHGGALTYTYQKRYDDSSLSYTVETTTNLVSGAVWVPAVGSVQTNVTSGDFDDVMQSIFVEEPQSYLRLKVTR